MYVFLTVCISMSFISEVIQLVNMSGKDDGGGRVGMARTWSS